MIYIPSKQGVHIDRIETTSQFCGVNGQLIEGSANPVFNDPHLPQTYAWYDISGGVLPVTDSLASLHAGSYIVVVTDRNGCTATATAIVPPPIFPNVTIDASQHEIILGDSARLTTHATANDILTYQWNPIPSYCLPCKQIEVGPLVSTIYTVTVTNLANCTATASTEILVLNSYNVYIPNIFTPNNDGINDHFTIQSGPNVSKIVSFRIFDRWGEVVFARNNIQTSETATSWDGNFKNQKAPMGIYVYVLEVEYVDGKHQLFHGDLTLME
jgi:gliding motility-associated-like protein